MITVHQISCFEDSFAYLVQSGKSAIAIDPGEGAKILEWVEKEELVLEAILLTHHHKAHVRDAAYLRNKTDATIMGPYHEALNFIDQEVLGGDECLIGNFTVQVLALPGHTRDHVGYYFPEGRMVFSGDVLYAGGCGKMLEGNGLEYFASIQLIKRLPLETQIWGGHGLAGVHLLSEEMVSNPACAAPSVEEFLKVVHAEI